MMVTIDVPAPGKFRAWLKILRLQFYPMTWLAYTMGALGAAAATGNWNAPAFWLGYSVPFLLEAATVLTNELFDYESDRRNRFYSPFNGGSRMLVTGKLRKAEVVKGLMTITVAAALCLIGLVLWLRTDLAVPLLFATMLVLGPGYTMPPLKLAWRGIGEPDVALTHSFAAVLWGYLIQGGLWHAPFPWLVSIPMFLAILPAILLAELPDMEADQAAGKRTLAVRIGRRGTASLALALTLLTPVSVWLLQDTEALLGAFRGLLPLAIGHALVLSAMLGRYCRTPIAGRIDRILILALSYILWFAVVPIVNLI